jgi:hypothetical protein
VAPARIAEQQVGEIADRDSRDATPTRWHKHPGSVSQVIYSVS